MAMGHVARIPATTTVSFSHRLRSILPTETSLKVILGPLIGLVIWWLPLGLEPVAHRAIAIVSLMLVYWMTEVLDHGLTA